MPYFAPYIDAQGLHIPTYRDIVEDLIQNAKAIFGQDIYLGIDSQDYQWISVVADKINDSFQLLEMVYNGRSPSTSAGSALDGIVKINGITRKSASYSTCVVTLIGSAGAAISNGVVQDKGGYLWDFPENVTIGLAGSVNVNATCQTIGAVQANIGEINSIFTPTLGWTSVSNSVAATMGTNIETDSELRSRQAISMSRPSRTVLEGTKGAIASVANVTRFIVYENDTNLANSMGHPAHSITAVVEGGLDVDIAKVIFDKKGPGCFTNGPVVVGVVDSFGQNTPIGFFRPTYVDIDVVLNVKQLAGYTTETTSAINAGVVAALNSKLMGDDLSISTLWAGSLSAMSAKPIYSITSITFAKHGQALGVADIVILFNEVVRGDLSYITVNLS